jgi:hypothetical protein
MTARNPARPPLRTLALAAALAACTDGHPLAPKTPAPRADGGVLQWIPMAHATLGTDGPTGEWHLQSTGITIPAGVTARVWVRGGLGVSYNPDYDQFCQGGGADGARDCGGHTYDGVSAGPFGLSDGSLVATLYADGPEGRRRVPLGVPSNGDGFAVDADVTGPAELWASRSGTGLYFAGVPAYLATGSQEIEVDTLGYPPGDGDGDGTGGNPGGGSGTPGDTAGGGCPAAAQRGADGPRLDCAPAPTDTAALMCNSSLAPDSVTVVRGGQMTCTVLHAGGMFTVSGWTYSDAEGHSTSGPQSESWGGTMVMGGTISARVRFMGGLDRTVSMIVHVSPRNQFGPTALPGFPNPLPSDSLRSLAEALAHDTTDGVFGQSIMRFSYNGHLAPGSGPNRDWWYLRDPPAVDDAEIWINPGLYPESPWHQAQDGRNGHCSGLAFDQIRALTIAHENEHQRRNYAFLPSARASSIWEVAVVYVSPDSAGVPGQINAVINKMHAPVRAVLDSLARDWDATSVLHVCRLSSP